MRLTGDGKGGLRPTRREAQSSVGIGDRECDPRWWGTVLRVAVIVIVLPWAEDERARTAADAHVRVVCMCLTRTGAESDKLDTLLIMARGGSVEREKRFAVMFVCDMCLSVSWIGEDLDFSKSHSSGRDRV